MIVFNTKDTKEKRKILRRSSTDAESKIWSKLRDKQFYGYKFYRQYGIDHYVADFYCPKLKLAIEIDGSSHYSKEGLAYDKERSDRFLSYGIRTMRFTNIEVLKNIAGVMQAIEGATPPSPLFEIKRGEHAPWKVTPSLSKRGIGGVKQIKFRAAPSSSRNI